jgi:predicted enzyme related to lactoylglutathione lyase
MTEPSPRFFLYLHCDDVASMREFYSRLVGLDEIFFEGGPEVLGYHIGDMQFTILPMSGTPEAAQDWHRQPGWAGGTATRPSWSIQLESLEAFRAAVRRIQETGSSTYHERTQWQGYWSFPVKDPMGNTAELTCEPVDEPASKVWPPA